MALPASPSSKCTTCNNPALASYTPRLLLSYPAKFAAAGSPSPVRLPCRLIPLLLCAFAVATTRGSPGGEDLPLFAAGPFQFRPHLSYSYRSEDGTLAQPGQPEKTEVQAATAGVLAGIGSHWNADYEATVTRYSNQQFQNQVEHSLSIEGSQTISEIGARFSQTLASSARPTFETGRQTKMLLSTTTLGGTYVINSSMALIGSFAQTLRFIEAAPDSNLWSGSAMVNFGFSPTLSAGIGSTAGYTAVYKSADTQYVGPSASLSWHPTKKLSASLQTSLEDRKFVGGTRARRQAVSYSGSASYTIFDQTSIDGNASRSNAPSLLPGQEVDSTKFAVNLRQRLLRHFQLGLNYGYEKTDFFSSGKTGITSRRDQIDTYESRLSTTLFKRCEFAAFYGRDENHSTDSAFRFSSTRFGGELSIRF